MIFLYPNDLELKFVEESSFFSDIFQESEETVSTQKRSTHSGQTVQGSNVFMDHKMTRHKWNMEQEMCCLR